MLEKDKMALAKLEVASLVARRAGDLVMRFRTTWDPRTDPSVVRVQLIHLESAIRNLPGELQEVEL